MIEHKGARKPTSNTNSDRYKALKEALKERLKQRSTTVPISIFARRDLGILEALVLFLSVERSLSHTEIARLISRDVRTVYATLTAAKKKQRAGSISDKGQDIPLDIFHSRELGPLEALALHLNRTGLTYGQIADLISRNKKTVYTALTRAKKKNKIEADGQIRVPEEIKTETANLIASGDNPARVQRFIEEFSEEPSIPTGVFSARDIGILEALTRYLADEYGLGSNKIGELIGRDHRIVWASIRNSRKKHPDRLTAEGIPVPASVFADRTKGPLEALVSHMSVLGLSYSEIGRALSRSPKTIWTVIRRMEVSK